MEVYCDTYSQAGLSPVLIQGQQGKVIVITALRVQNESTTDNTIIVMSGGTPKSRICAPNKGDGFDRVYEKNRELVLGLGEDFRVSNAVAAQTGITAEWMYR